MVNTEQQGLFRASYSLEIAFSHQSTLHLTPKAMGGGLMEIELCNFLTFPNT